MKKFFKIMILATLIVFAACHNQTEAREIYSGKYSDGTDVYLIYESINIKNYNPFTFTCRVRAGRDYINYYFYQYNGQPYYRNSEGYQGYVRSNASPVARGIYRFVSDSTSP